MKVKLGSNVMLKKNWKDKTGLQTIMHEPQKGKRHRTIDPSGVEPIHIIGHSLGRRMRSWIHSNDGTHKLMNSA